MIGPIILLLVGGLAGVIASTVEGGRNKGRNIAIGVVDALLLAFLLALGAACLGTCGGRLFRVAVKAMAMNPSGPDNDPSSAARAGVHDC